MQGDDPYTDFYNDDQAEVARLDDELFALQQQMRRDEIEHLAEVRTCLQTSSLRFMVNPTQRAVSLQKTVDQGHLALLLLYGCPQKGDVQMCLTVLSLLPLAGSSH